MATYLATGGCGFIGSHLAHALVQAGHHVRILDDLSTGRRERAPAAADLIVGDVADPRMAERALAGVDGCFHLAAIASVQRSVEDWLGTHRTNLTGTIAIFDAARRARRGGPLPVVYASSAAVYGRGSAAPLSEDAVLLPLSAYGADKLGCELHARVATLTQGVRTVGLRFFNVYGPGQIPDSPYSGVISIFADRLARGEPLDVYGDGEQVRDFVYVDDVVRHLIAAMADPAEVPGIFNVCTGRGTTVSALAHLLAELSGGPLELRFLPPRPGDIKHSVGDPARAIARFGLVVETKLAEGLRSTFHSLTACRPVAGAARW